MPATRPITDRLQDRLWSIWTRRIGLDLPAIEGEASAQGSISGPMAWPKACNALANGIIPSSKFRRLLAVMEVVETLGPCDGRHHARRIIAAGQAAWLDHPDVLSLASWGDPLRWPARLLETPHPFAPTTLRYLSHALWLHDQGISGEGARLVEIGAGYGGLAAMNCIISKAQTTLVDLPDVERAAMTMLSETGLPCAATSSAGFTATSGIDCVISNYAFTELSESVQDHLLDQYIAHAKHGMILSNAGVFAKRIGGRTDDAILAALKDRGIHANIHTDHPLLSPSDRHFASSLILW